MEADKQEAMPPEAVVGDQDISDSSRPTCESLQPWASHQESPEPQLTTGTHTFGCL